MFGVAKLVVAFPKVFKATLLNSQYQIATNQWMTHGQLTGSSSIGKPTVPLTYQDGAFPVVGQLVGLLPAGRDLLWLVVWPQQQKAGILRPQLQGYYQKHEHSFHLTNEAAFFNLVGYKRLIICQFVMNLRINTDNMSLLSNQYVQFALKIQLVQAL